MNDRMKKWIDALRSGNYTQARGGLRDGDGFCCLGVMCDLEVNEDTVHKWRGNYFDFNGDPINSFASFPPNSLMREYGIGLSMTIPVLDRSDKPITIANLNDVGRLNFDEIADTLAYFFKEDTSEEPHLPHDE